MKENNNKLTRSEHLTVPVMMGISFWLVGSWTLSENFWQSGLKIGEWAVGLDFNMLIAAGLTFLGLILIINCVRKAFKEARLAVQAEEIIAKFQKWVEAVEGVERAEELRRGWEAGLVDFEQGMRELNTYLRESGISESTIFNIQVGIERTVGKSGEITFDSARPWRGFFPKIIHTSVDKKTVNHFDCHTYMIGNVVS